MWCSNGIEPWADGPVSTAPPGRTETCEDVPTWVDVSTWEDVLACTDMDPKNLANESVGFAG